jgi:hypothetical protein
MKSFENFDIRIGQVNCLLNKYEIGSLDEAVNICNDHNINVEALVKKIQPICFQDACYAFIVGTAIALKKPSDNINEICNYIGEGLQSFCIPGSVADQRKIGLGHGSLAARLLSKNSECFAFVSGHSSFAASQGAKAIIESVNKLRTIPLRIILNGLGKDAAYIISRMNGFTYVKTIFDHNLNLLKIIDEIEFSNNNLFNVKCYGCDSVQEGVEINHLENVDIAITGNSCSAIRFQHAVMGIYKKERLIEGKQFYSIASGGGTGRTLHPDNVAAGPASYGMTDTMGRMHSDIQFAGSSSVPAHVELAGFIGMGNNPIVGANVNIVTEIYRRIVKNKRMLQNEYNNLII